MIIALVAVVAAVAMAVLGDGGALKDAEPDRLEDRLPPDRPLVRSDIDAVRLPVAVRGYRMMDVDEVLDRLGAELAERDARIADLEASLAGVSAARVAEGADRGGAREAAYGSYGGGARSGVPEYGGADGPEQGAGGADHGAAGDQRPGGGRAGEYGGHGGYGGDEDGRGSE